MDSVHAHEPSTSASTIRGLRHLDMASYFESPAVHDDAHGTHSPFRPSTPHSAFHSEPGSPSGDSVSSFPSVGSSFLFSSGPTSPPHPGHHSEREYDEELGDSTSGLVIPSLMLPSPSRRPTTYGQTLGDVRLLLLGPRGADMSAIASQLVDDNEDVVEVGLWEEDRQEGANTRGKRKATLHVSTDWVEHRDRHGLERIEPARNVEIVELPSYDSHTEAQTIVERVLPVIHYPFHEVLDLLNHDHPPSGTLSHLLSSSCSPLYTALILLATPSALPPAEKSLIESLSTHIPIIILPPSPLHRSPSSHEHEHEHGRRASSSHLSAFRPTSLAALRNGLFRSPNTLATLRAEAAARFLRWREVERAVERVRWSASGARMSAPGQRSDTTRPAITSASGTQGDWFDKQAWEAQWGDELSREVALHLRRRRPAPPSLSPSHSPARKPPANSAGSGERAVVSPSCGAALDPLHIPSLVVFSFSLLGALRTRVARSLGWAGAADVQGAGTPRRRPSISRKGEKELSPRRGGVGYTLGLGLALVSAFCAGVGIGLVVAARF
ncbi:hypothetical protein BD309DRAFT_952414 [Dichomitus squalens]|nr:hypothetical protein BD309DRAFT_952414 [Dichomitus squalens]